MSKITVEHARDGGHSAAVSKANVLPASSTFKSPFDVLYKKNEEAPPPKTTRIRTSQGTIVKFPDDWKRGDGQVRRRTTIASDEAGAPRFKLGDHQLDVEVAERLNALPSRRYMR